MSYVIKVHVNLYMYFSFDFLGLENIYFGI
jgi:hypothetical protein